MHTLVAIDDSPYSKDSIEQLLQECGLTSLHITILTVLEPLDCLSEYASDTQISDLQARRHAGAESLCQHVRNRIKQARPKARVDYEIRNGDPAGEIIKAAFDGKVDRIVMGARSRDICPHGQMGSVSRYVAAHAPCSVEIVRVKKQRATKTRRTAASTTASI